MPPTEELTPKTNKKNSMDEQTLWYLSGAVDSVINLKVQITNEQTTTIGYAAKPEIVINRPKKLKSVIGMLDEYTEEFGIHYRQFQTDSSIQFKVRGQDHVRRFLEPIVGGFIQQRERAEYFLDEVLPLFDDGRPTTKKKLMEVAKASEKLNQYPITRSSKYDVDYFRDEWNMS